MVPTGPEEINDAARFMPNDVFGASAMSSATAPMIAAAAVRQRRWIDPSSASAKPCVRLRRSMRPAASSTALRGLSPQLAALRKIPCGGSGYSRRRIGERVSSISWVRASWRCCAVLRQNEVDV